MVSGWIVPVRACSTGSQRRLSRCRARYLQRRSNHAVNRRAVLATRTGSCSRPRLQAQRRDLGSLPHRLFGLHPRCRPPPPTQLRHTRRPRLQSSIRTGVDARMGVGMDVGMDGRMGVGMGVGIPKNSARRCSQCPHRRRLGPRARRPILLPRLLRLTPLLARALLADRHTPSLASHMRTVVRTNATMEKNGAEAGRCTVDEVVQAGLASNGKLFQP